MIIPCPVGNWIPKSGGHLAGELATQKQSGALIRRPRWDNLGMVCKRRGEVWGLYPGLLVWSSLRQRRSQESWKPFEKSGQLRLGVVGTQIQKSEKQFRAPWTRDSHLLLSHEPGRLSVGQWVDETGTPRIWTTSRVLGCASWLCHFLFLPQSQAPWPLGDAKCVDVRMKASKPVHTGVWMLFNQLVLSEIYR